MQLHQVKGHNSNRATGAELDAGRALDKDQPHDKQDQPLDQPLQYEQSGSKKSAQGRDIASCVCLCDALQHLHDLVLDWLPASTTA